MATSIENLVDMVADILSDFSQGSAEQEPAVQKVIRKLAAEPEKLRFNQGVVRILRTLEAGDDYEELLKMPGDSNGWSCLAV